MRILFMGTPEFAVPSLDILNKDHDIVGLFTKVDKPNMRGKKIKFTPVKEYALEHNIPIYQPKSVKTEETSVWSLYFSSTSSKANVAASSGSSAFTMDFHLANSMTNVFSFGFLKGISIILFIISVNLEEVKSFYF